jgi:dihydropteroate synthase
MVNDVTAARDPRMVDVLRAHPNAAIVLMHMLGEPKTMQDDPQYAGSRG